MTHLEIRTEIERLELKVESALNKGDMGRERHYLGDIEELEEELSVMPHEFGGEARCGS